MDFYRISSREIEKGPRKGEYELYPDFHVGRSKDLMIRGRAFYAIWDEKEGLWSTDEYDVQRLVDEELEAYAATQSSDGYKPAVKSMRSFHSNSWKQFRQFISQISDNAHQLDDKLTFSNTEVKKTDYISRRLPYALAPGDYSAWDELVGTLYSVEERRKIEWAIGAIVSGDSRKIQKFLVMYGPAGTGKSTILNIVQSLFEGYTATFEAKALGSSNAAFATEVFKDNPLVAIQHDGDLSKIEDNTKLNSIISHEMMTMNVKFKAAYDARVNAFLLMGTNQPVKISDAKSGIIRRLIDVTPTGVIIPENHYNVLMSKIDFELGAIAQHCLDVYRALGKNYYTGYRPVEMMFQTDVFFNFIEHNFDIFKSQKYTSLAQAYALYNEYCNDTGVDRVLPQYKVREELRNYFEEFHDKVVIEEATVRSVYSDFNANKFRAPVDSETPYSFVLEEETSLLDDLLKAQPAQYSRITDLGDEIPEKFWTNEKKLINGEIKEPTPDQVVSTTLNDLDTSKLHFVKLPQNHIVIDFDLKDEDGNKSLEKNLAAASSWPPTYAELSKGGNGVHLHYIYEGDVTQLSNMYSEGIEIKTLLGDASLRRRLSKCNNIPVATRNGGLPLKEKKLISSQTMSSEKSVRDMLIRNLHKEFHGSTKPSVDFMKKILDDAYDSGMSYDVTDMRNKIIAFATNSNNQPLQCLKVVQTMKFASAVPTEQSVEQEKPPVKDDRIVFYDIEVYPNLFVVCWKYQGGSSIVRMINPEPHEIEALLKYKLVGFNNRRYDNHILYARYMGHSIEQLYARSQKIIVDKGPGSMFGAAYNLSYADIYEFSSVKQSLKMFEIKLGIKHLELDLPWDQPVDPELWERVTDYCANDVLATEAVFEDRKQDFVARQILADLSGLTVNDTTARHAARIFFGDDRNPSEKFVYTALEKMFPGYSFEAGKSHYRGELVGEGGYVYAEPGMYKDVTLLDIASMHPTSLQELNYFGPYTKNFTALKDARIAIKHGKYDEAKKMLGGKLAPHLGNPADADALSYALKIVINIIYGLTSAKFDNPFRMLRNRDNIVAKRGALFMIDLKHEAQEKGLTVAHIKTDSIKIPGATKEDIEDITNYGSKFGYDFEHEATYDRFCLVNDAVYIARYGWAAKPSKIGTWEAVGAQFQHPYVFKTLFSHEPIVFNDLCETKQVTKGGLYLDFQLDRANETPVEGMKFVGRTGRFVPVEEGQNGAILNRVVEGKAFAATGTKGYLWVEAETASGFGDDLKINMKYFDKLVEAARKTIEKYGDFEEFTS